MRTSLIAAVVAAGCALSSAQALSANLADGTYYCLNGASAYGNLTTPGEIEIRGATYRFHENGKPNDQPFSGYTFNAAERSISWKGPMGFMSKPPYAIGATKLDAVAKNSFWFPLSLNNRPMMSVSCGMK